MKRKYIQFTPRWITVTNGLKHEKYTNVFVSEKKTMKSGFKWCLHCFRAYPVGSFRFDANDPDEITLLYCPYDGCNGDYLFDGWDWQKFAEAHGYPLKPILGKKYPLEPK